MATLVFDIETAGHELTEFDESQLEYLFKFCDTPEKRELEIQKLNLYPLTAQVVAIAMINPETDSGQVLYQPGHQNENESGDRAIQFVPGNERDILTTFWQTLHHYPKIVTFNGRAFDGPFLMLRSAILKIIPSRNLVTYRYESSAHCDLLDQLTYYGATRKFNLDFYCKAFGIPSPKCDGVTGLQVAELFRSGRGLDIARYCLGDVRATAELYRRWYTYLNFSKGRED